MVRYYLNGAPLDLTGFSKMDAEFQADTDGTAEKVYINVTLDGRKLLCLVDTGASTRLLIAVVSSPIMAYGRSTAMPRHRTM